MSDRFHPIAMPDLLRWITEELATHGSIFGFPRRLTFVPSAHDPFRTRLYTHELDTPIGVAAGPHTQMAQNIVLAWLAGARIMELKTVQVLDELSIGKPCISMRDEGYNVEWSQELSIDQSIDEYVRAWVLIHALHRLLGHPGDRPGVLFNMSVGYDLEGVQSPKVRRFVDTMLDASALVAQHTAAVAGAFPELTDLQVPSRLSDSVTLSTMHGCPPDEIGRISEFLMDEWGLHTSVKLNPTLLGAGPLRELLNHELGYRHIHVPDTAFAHDIGFGDAVALLNKLEAHARDRGVVFGVKLTNTLEVVHDGSVFPGGEQSMYLSGRPLHALSVAVAHKLGEAFDGSLMMSFAGGADAFNVASLLAAGMVSVTTCSDLLRPGGYSRLLQYLEEIRDTMAGHGARTLEELIAAVAARAGDDTACGQSAALANLHRYADTLGAAPELKRDAFARNHTKTARPLGLFDCIQAPCTDACFVDQRVPGYLRAVAAGRMDEALAVTRHDNPLPTVLGHACNHPCEEVCLRTHYDRPLAIREVKRFIMSHEKGTPVTQLPQLDEAARVAVIGGGPCGLAAASFLARAGLAVTVFEAQPYSGGMVAGTIPAYRADDTVMERDLDAVRALGVELRHGVRLGSGCSLSEILDEGFRYAVVATGCQRGVPLPLDNGSVPDVLDGLEFLRAVKHGTPPPLGPRVAVVGGGDVAMDCARSAHRLGAEVTVLYRRSREEMPAQNEEVEDLLAEGIALMELVNPRTALTDDVGRLQALECVRIKLGEPDDSGRRRPLEQPGSSFRLEVDQVVAAIGQMPQLDFLSAEGVELDRSGKVAVDPETLETSRPGVFAGGDAVDLGPLSIVRAWGDGRRIAATICAREGAVLPELEARRPELDREKLLLRRARREPRVEVPELPLDQRSGFAQVLLPLAPDTARREAARCLDCDLMCGTCESVCPNHAIFSYRAAPRTLELPLFEITDGGLRPAATSTHPLDQEEQVAVLTDLCNECGNCATFCPTSGEPYRHKPRLYLNWEDYAAEEDNAFMLGRGDGGWWIRGRFQGVEHKLDLGAIIRYHSPRLELELSRDSLRSLAHRLHTPEAEGTRIELTELATMLLLLEAIKDGAPGLPLASHPPIPGGS